MPSWDSPTIQRFQRAEAALVGRQMELAGSEKQIWAGWRNIGAGAFRPYGELLAEERFEEIEELVRKL